MRAILSLSLGLACLLSSACRTFSRQTCAPSETSAACAAPSASPENGSSESCRDRCGPKTSWFLWWRKDECCDKKSSGDCVHRACAFVTYQPLCGQTPPGVEGGNYVLPPIHTFFECSTYNKPLQPIDCGPSPWCGWFSSCRNRDECKAESEGDCRDKCGWFTLRWPTPFHRNSEECAPTESVHKSFLPAARECKSGGSGCNSCAPKLGGLLAGNSGCGGGAAACPAKSLPRVDNLPILSPTLFRKYAPCDAPTVAAGPAITPPLPPNTPPVVAPVPTPTPSPEPAALPAPTPVPAMPKPE